MGNGKTKRRGGPNDLGETEGTNGQPILPSGCPKDKGTRIPKTEVGKFKHYGIRS